MTNETPQQRSRIMRAVRSKNTKPEMIVRKASFALGYRHRLHDAKLPGKPDLIYPSRKKVIFVHGCFWHGHNCKRGARIPKTNREYWERKISANKSRDIKNQALLQFAGWSVLILWECEINDKDELSEKLKCFLEK